MTDHAAGAGGRTPTQDAPAPKAASGAASGSHVAAEDHAASGGAEAGAPAKTTAPRTTPQDGLLEGRSDAGHDAVEAVAVEAVAAAARAAYGAVDSLAKASDAVLDAALRVMARRLEERAAPVLEANAADQDAARAAGISGGLLDRLRLDPGRLAAMATQLHALADVAPEPNRRPVRELPGGLVLEEWRRPVGAIGANFEARPNVVVDIASQFVKSRNGGVLRTGSAALGSAIALVDEVVAPALREAGLDPDAIQLVRTPGHESAQALVTQPQLLPLVILRGSGGSTRQLAERAAAHGVRTLAHADGGAVIYVDKAADPVCVSELIDASLDRLGVCNRLNLLLTHEAVWDVVVP
ncbi:MAG: aldehyde dehydrogenase family protein, partial [Micromonosporaceae bacterium]